MFSNGLSAICHHVPSLLYQLSSKYVSSLLFWAFLLPISLLQCFVCVDLSAIFLTWILLDNRRINFKYFFHNLLPSLSNNLSSSLLYLSIAMASSSRLNSLPNHLQRERIFSWAISHFVQLSLSTTLSLLSSTCCVSHNRHFSPYISHSALCALSILSPDMNKFNPHQYTYDCHIYLFSLELFFLFVC